MLKTVNLTKKYKNGVVAVNDVSICLPDKGMYFVLGKSGSGKSTLLNLLAGVDKCTSGLISYNNIVITEKNTDEYRRNYVGFVYQDYQLISGLSVYENVALAREVLGLKADRTTVEALLAEVGVAELIDRKPAELSGGQAQRVAIARALIKEGATVFADEPTGNLDAESGKGVFELLKKISKDRLVITVTHDRESAELYGDGIIEIADGKILADSATKNINVESGYRELEKTRDGLRFKSLLKLAKWSAGKRVVKQIMYIAAMALLVAVNVVSYAFLTTNEERILMSSFRQNSPNSIMVLKNDSYGGTNKESLRMSKVSLASLGEKANVELFPFDKSGMGYTADASAVYRIKNGSGVTMFGNFWRLRYAIFINKPEALDIEFVEGSKPVIGNQVAVPRIYADNIISNGYMQTASPIVYGASGEDANDIVEVASYADLIGKPFYAYDCKFVISGIFEDNSMYKGDARCMPESERHEFNHFGNDTIKDTADGFILDKCAIFSRSKAFEYYIRQSPSYVSGFLESTYLYASYNGILTPSVGDPYLFDSELFFLPQVLKSIPLKEGEIFITQTAIDRLAVDSGGNKLTVGDTLKLGYQKGSITKAPEEYKIAGIINDGWYNGISDFGLNYVAPYELIGYAPIIFSQKDYSKITSVTDFLMQDSFSNITGFVYNARKAPDKTFSILKKEIITKLRYANLYVPDEESPTEIYDTQVYNTASLESDISSMFSGTLFQILEIRYYVALPLFLVSIALLLLFLALFCGVTFEAKEREVGILKALGAKKRDVYLIFIIQIAMTALVYFAIGSIIGGVALMFLNKFFTQNLAGLMSVLPYTADNFFVVLFTVLACVVGAIGIQIRRLLKKSAMQIMRQ